MTRPAVVTGPLTREQAFIAAGGTVRSGLDALDAAGRQAQAASRGRDRIRPAVRGRHVDVPVAQLHPDPDNPRGPDVGDVTELAASMEHSGLLQPVLARRTPTGDVIVIAGHRRLAAAKQLGWRYVPTIVVPDLPADEVLAAMLAENGQRADLDPVAEARAYKALADKHGVAEVVRLTGKSQWTIYQRLKLLDLPVHEQAALRAGETTLREASSKAREAGRVKAGRAPSKGSSDKGWHFGHTHPLADLARDRCDRARQRDQGKHALGRRVAGGIACGDCWQSTIEQQTRADLMAELESRGRLR